MQKLILPIKHCKLTASYDTQAYWRKYGARHYGVDIENYTGNRRVYASGSGLVVGTDSNRILGNTIAVIYWKGYYRPLQAAHDVVFRYFHLDTIAVKPGDLVNIYTVLGYYGNTGCLAITPHMHLEADTGLAYAMHSPTMPSNPALRMRGISVTNPMDWLYCKRSAPDLQEYQTNNDAYIRKEDYVLPEFD